MGVLLSENVKFSCLCFNPRNPQPMSSCRNMLEHIHERRFHTRLWPCIQSRNDSFRIFLYDVATAGENSGNLKPLLMRRHNVDAGMFLVRHEQLYDQSFLQRFETFGL